MIGKALKTLASQYQLTLSHGIAYGYLQGSYVTLSDTFFSHRMCIYVGCVNLKTSDTDPVSPAAKCASMIVEMINKGAGDKNIYAFTNLKFLPSPIASHKNSVVTINFSRNQRGLNGLQRFIAEMLPRITPLTAPLQCSHCGGHTAGQGYPVQIAPDTVLPMHSECFLSAIKVFNHNNNSNVSIIGAVIGSLLGALGQLWFIHSGLNAILGALCILFFACLGARLFNHQPERKVSMIVGVCIFIALFFSYFGGLIWQLHDQYNAFGKVVADMMTEKMYIWVSIKTLFTNTADLSALLLYFVMSILFALFGIAITFSNTKGFASAETPKARPGKA